MPTYEELLKNAQERLASAGQAIAVAQSAVASALVVGPGPSPTPTPTPTPPPAPTPTPPSPTPSKTLFRWSPADGTFSPAHTQIEPKGGKNSIVAITKGGAKWLEARAGDFSSGATAKCGLEYNSYFAVKEGNTIRLSFDSEFDPSDNYENCFVGDFETTDDKSTGPRFKLRRDGTIVFSGDKIGAGILNGTGKFTDPGRVSFEILVHSKNGWAKVTNNGKVIGEWRNIRTMGANPPTKAQWLLTANSSGRPQVQRAKGIELLVY